MTWTNYSNTGPFSNNAAPGISATFLNNVETFLDQFAGSAVTDSHISVDGAGKITVLKIALTLGSLTRLSKFTGTATTTSTFFNHGLGVVPDIVLLQLNGTSASPHGIWVEYSSMTTTQCKITSDGTNPFVGLAIQF